jgi:PEP-CTERM motif
LLTRHGVEPKIKPRISGHSLSKIERIGPPWSANGPVYSTFGVVPSPYPPASPFSPDSVSLLYTVTSVPEPATLLLVGTALLSFLFARPKVSRCGPLSRLTAHTTR